MRPRHGLLVVVMIAVTMDGCRKAKREKASRDHCVYCLVEGRFQVAVDDLEEQDEIVKRKSHAFMSPSLLEVARFFSGK